jgi:hypothetical protein
MAMINSAVKDEARVKHEKVRYLTTFLSGSNAVLTAVCGKQ